MLAIKWYLLWSVVLLENSAMSVITVSVFVVALEKDSFTGIKLTVYVVNKINKSFKVVILFIPG